MNFTKVTSIPSSAKFCALVSSEELLQIKLNTVSIVSVRTGFCKYFYFLPQVPRLFAISQSDGSRFAVVYPSSGSKPESVAILETKNGEVLKQFALKNSTQKFSHIAMGEQLFFVVDSQPSVVFYTPPQENQISQYDCTSPVSYLCVNSSKDQFLCFRNDKHVVVVDAESNKQTNDIIFNPFSFITLSDSTIIYGLSDGFVMLCNLTSNENKDIATPHSSKPLNVSNGLGVTSDGIIFSVENGEAMGTVSKPISIMSYGSITAVLCEKCIEIYECAKWPVCTVSQLQPPEPFVNNEFSVEPQIYFAASTAIYTFTISVNDISKFTSINEKIKKIVTCQACLSMVYNSSEGDKIATFTTGIKKRDELGIDVLCDSNNVTWILEKNCILSFRRQHLDLQQIRKIDLPEDHTYVRIFRIGKTVGVYSPTDGITAYINNGNLIQFRLPQNVNIIQWPALCTKNIVYICNNQTEKYEELRVDDFNCVNASITSCCWLANTLFCVEKRKVLAIGRNGSRKVVERLPNTMCSIAAALPSELIFVSTLPDLRVVSIKRPFLYVTLLDMTPDDVQCLKYILYYMPALSIDPRSVSNLPPIIAMSIFNKAPPKFVTQKTVAIYSKFARFMEVINLTRNMVISDSPKDPEANIKERNKILKAIAESARAIGQFAIAQQLYEELGDDESLFTLFILSQSRHNLGVLAAKSKLASSIIFFGINPIPNAEYEPLQNMQLPKIRSPLIGEEFTLFAGDPSEGSPIFPPSFDEPTDFGLREFPLTGEEAQQEMNFQAELEAAENAGESKEPEEPIEYKERPQEETHKSDDDLQLDKFFEDDDEEEPQKKMSFKIDMTKSSRRGAPRGFQLDSGLSSTGPQVLSHPVESGGRRKTMVMRANRKFTLDIPTNIANEAPVISSKSSSDEIDPLVGKELFSQYNSSNIDFSKDQTSDSERNNDDNPADQYMSSLFTDIPQ